MAKNRKHYSGPTPSRKREGDPTNTAAVSEAAAKASVPNAIGTHRFPLPGGEHGGGHNHDPKKGPPAPVPRQQMK
jgi:hypothetical protein